MSQVWTTRPELHGTFGMVASTHWLGSSAGMAALERGGNAFDAAVTAGFTLQVVEPHLNGPGGDLPAILWRAGEPGPVVLCAQGPAPAAATMARYREELGLGIVPGTGPLAAVVPGAFGGWMAMLRDYGSLRLRDVLEPAIGYAGTGFPVLSAMAASVRAVEALFREEWAPSAAVYLPVPRPGQLARNARLAQTYQRVVDEAEAATADRDGQIEAAMEAWYRGWVADAIVKFQEHPWLDTSGARHTGLIAYEDLAGWAPAYERPARCRYRGLDVFKPGPWSQGAVFLQQLQLLEGFDVAALAQRPARLVHTVTECAKLAFADREAWYGDPRFVEVPLEGLLSPSYADQRRRLVGEEASAVLNPGTPEGARPPKLPALVRGPAEPPISPGLSALRFRGDTVHIDAADRFGNLVSATPSGGWLSGAPVIPDLGFCLGTRAQMFWLEPGLPASLEPGKRPRTTLSPTMAGRDGVPYLATGTPGGDQQDQWALHTFLAHIDLGLDLQAAIDSPNHHTEAFPSSFYPRASRPLHLAIEERVGPTVLEQLRSMGHAVVAAGPWSLGRVTSVSRDPAGGLKGAADPRQTQAYVAGR